MFCLTTAQSKINIMDSTSSDIILARDDTDGVCTITLNRPEQFNSLSEELLTAVKAALHDISNDSSVRVVVLAGSGRAFCAGHDLKQMRANSSHEYQTALFKSCSEMMMAITQLPQPVIARVHGAAVAAGCQLVANCDLAIASDNARFAVSGINLGLFCGTPSVPLSRNVPRKRALEMLFLGDQIDAATAEQWHLVNRVVALDELDDAIDSWTTILKAKPPEALAMGKRAWYQQIDQPLIDAYATATDMMASNMMLDDTQEGIDAFIEKRDPSWK